MVRNIAIASKPSASGLSLLAKAAQVSQSPKLSIEVYDHGVMVRTGTAFYAVDPAQVAKALAADMPDPIFDTAMLSDDILRVYQKGDERVVFSYRAPQMTGIWLDGSEDALQVPMPGLVLARKTSSSRDNGGYAICAVTRRPVAGSKVFRAPLPNSNHNGVCWGTVSKPFVSDLSPNDMEADWTMLLGSSFNTHQVNGKSKSFSDDIRKLLKDMSSKKLKKYPYADLYPIVEDARKKADKQKPYTFSDWMREVINR